MKFNKRQYIKKFNLLGIAISLIFISLILYSSNIQILNHDTYRNEVSVNAIRQRKLPAPRGDIFDRNGMVLATSIYQNDLYLIPNYFHGTIDSVCDIVQVNCDELSNKLKKYPNNRILISKNISDAQAEMFKSTPGVFIYRFSKRKYESHHVIHVIGYVGKINRDVLETDNDDSIYASDDFVGQSGIEYIYDRDLHGINGAEQYIVMANGLELSNPNRFLKHESTVLQPIDGKALTLYIDKEIQSIFAESIGGRTGAAVMIDVNNGSVISMYSSPEFDPKNVKNVFNDNNYPLINRAISAYAPGSTFKIVTALAALEMGVVDPHEKVNCPGTYTFGGRVWHCWKHEGHGNVDLRDAIKHSCDVYFYKLSQKVGLDNINRYAAKLGLGEYSHIDLDGESKGRIPTINWYKKSYNDGYNPGSLLNTVIGQGVVQVTPLQLANAYAVIANGGNLYAPKIVSDVVQPIPTKENNFNKQTIDILQDALYSVVNEEGGTAYNARIPGLNVAGKTGTAQTAGLGKKKKDNAWFAGFYPAKNPQISVCVFIEAGGHGSSVAPIAFKAIQKYKELNEKH